MGELSTKIVEHKMEREKVTGHRVGKKKKHELHYENLICQDKN